jgi:hypothetical protein
MLISRETAGKRSSRSSCSNACRMKVYYGHIVQARNLSRQGGSQQTASSTIQSFTSGTFRRIKRNPRVRWRNLKIVDVLLERRGDETQAIAAL